MWLYIPQPDGSPSTSSASAPEAAALISRSSWQFQTLERSAWSRGKALPAARWYQQWKRALWLQRLCGAMPEPSTADHGAALWMASLAASRASLTALPESGVGRKTSATSGPSRGALSSSRARGSSLSKTSVGCCLRAVRNVSGETFRDWALRLREDCSQRRKLARHTSANGSSSSQWPTVMANEARLGFQDRSDQTKRGTQESLSTAVALWATPQARDGKGANQSGLCDRGTKAAPLNEVAVLWMTPRSHEVGNYQYSRGDKSKPVATLTGQAIKWKEMGVTYFRLVPKTSTGGEPHSPLRRSLNPLFVEWLMGWPPGWTLLAWTDLGCSATALCLWKARMRSALLALGLPQEAPPAQLGFVL